MSNIRCSDCGFMSSSKVFTSSSCVNCCTNDELPHKKRSGKVKPVDNFSETEQSSMDIDNEPSTSSVVNKTKDESIFSYPYEQYGFRTKEKFYVKQHRKDVDESSVEGITLDTNRNRMYFVDSHVLYNPRLDILFNANYNRIMLIDTAIRRDPLSQTILKCDGIHDSCMNTRHKCCICMDKRPLDFSYEGYVDGKGYKKCNSRNQYYCPSCKEKTN